MNLRYHERTFRHLGLEPAASPESEAVLKELESRHSFKFPASVREWFVLEGAVKILNDCSFSDQLVPLRDLGPAREHYRDDVAHPFHDYQKQPVMHFTYENQGVCAWGVWLNGADDPPVGVQGSLRKQGWLPAADSFSDFILHRAMEFGGNYPFFVCAQPAVSDSSWKQFLPTILEQGPSTYSYPGESNHVFSSNEFGLVLFVDDDGSIEWNVFANGVDVLERTLRDFIARGFFKPSDAWGHRETEVLLRKLKAEQ